MPAEVPKDLPRGKVGQCYDHCVANLLMPVQRRKYKYVEGITRDPRDPRRWVLHAWITDGKRAFDLTWGQMTPIGMVPILTDYIGIEMPIKKVAAFMLDTEYAGVFANAWRSPEQARECVPGMPVEKISVEFYLPVEYGSPRDTTRLL